MKAPSEGHLRSSIMLKSASSIWQIFLEPVKGEYWWSTSQEKIWQCICIITKLFHIVKETVYDKITNKQKILKTTVSAVLHTYRKFRLFFYWHTKNTWSHETVHLSLPSFPLICYVNWQYLTWQPLFLLTYCQLYLRFLINICLSNYISCSPPWDKFLPFTCQPSLLLLQNLALSRPS